LKLDDYFFFFFPLRLAAFFLAFLFAAAILAFLLATGCALANPMHHPTTQINIISISSVAGMSDSYTLGVDKSSIKQVFAGAKADRNHSRND
jgi:predicted outer membrane protein